MPTERPKNPLPGDIHLLADYLPETSWQEIFDFEVFDGNEWVHAKDGPRIYPIGLAKERESK